MQAQYAPTDAAQKARFLGTVNAIEKLLNSSRDHTNVVNYLDGLKVEELEALVEYAREAAAHGLLALLDDELSAR